MESTNKDLSRRDFLKLASLVPLGLAVSRIPVVRALSENVEKAVFLTPDFVDGVAVYGLKSNIGSVEFETLKREFNKEFEKKAIAANFLAAVIPDSLTDPEKRDCVWGANTRVLEVVVRRSDYLNDPLGGSLVQRMKVELDLMNRILENAHPQPGLRAQLARIIVVEDGFKINPAGSDIANDVDHSEFIGGLEAGNKFDRIAGEFTELWNVDADNFGNAIIRWKQGQGVFREEFYLPGKVDSVTSLGGFLVSSFRIHDLWHRLFNFTDRYVQDIVGVNSANFRFKNFENFDGKLIKPVISPFLAMLGKWIREQNIRGHFDHPRSTSISQQNQTDIWRMKPRKISLNIPGAESIKIYRPNMNGGYYRKKNPGEKEKTLNDTPDQVSKNSKFTLNPKLFIPTKFHEPSFYENEQRIMTGQDVDIVPTLYVVQAKVNGKNKELFIPVEVFVMSRLSGKWLSAKYKIEFLPESQELNTDTLIAVVVETKNVDSYIKAMSTPDSSKSPYAKMKIEGTAFHMVWYQENNIVRIDPLDTQRPNPFENPED